MPEMYSKVAWYGEGQGAECGGSRFYCGADYGMDRIAEGKNINWCQTLISYLNEVLRSGFETSDHGQRSALGGLDDVFKTADR